jgi:amidase
VVHGPTRNPWNVERSPGGSSGGAAALVASRALPLAHANDAGGSIRIPAAWCGLVGLKPSRGLVPIGPSVGEAVGGFAHEFAVTRSVRDAALLLDAISGPAPGDRYYVTRPSSKEPGPLRVAVHTRAYFGVETAPEVVAVVEAVARELERLGHHVEEACPEVKPDALRTCVTTVWSVDLAELAATFERATGRAVGPDTVEAASLACIRHGRELSALGLQDAQRVVNSTSRRWGRFLDDYDLFLCPTAPTAATASGTPDMDDPAIETAEAWIDRVFSLSPFTPVANLTGQPSVSLPLGETQDGLPLGVMLTAQMLRDDVLLHVAAQLEQALPWAGRTPAICAG